MNRHLLLLVVVFMELYPFTIIAQNPEPVDLQALKIDPVSFPSGHPKTPIVPPLLSLDDHTLYFNTPCDGCTLNIVDSNDVVVYTTVIPTGATSLVLPATLLGEYELQIISGNYLFYGTIDLP